MISFLKFGVTFALPPGLFMLFFLWMAVRLWRRRQKEVAGAIFVVTLILYAISTPYLSAALMRNLEAAYPLPENPSGDVIVLLGGGATKGTPDMDGAGGLSEGSATRLLAAARLYHKLHIPILFTGGRVLADGPSEAETARRDLLGLGVPDEAIILEPESRTTGENAKFTAEVLNTRGFAQPILVTSAFHMKRSVLNFENNGVTVQPFPVGYRVDAKPRELHYIWFGPEAYALDNSVCVMREELRFLVTKMTGF